jgi:surfactin synthase thioesterase subunit
MQARHSPQPARTSRIAQITDEEWTGDLTEYGGFPGEVAEKLEVLNKAIAEAQPDAWWQDKVSIDVAGLRQQIAPAEIGL